MASPARSVAADDVGAEQEIRVSGCQYGRADQFGRSVGDQPGREEGVQEVQRHQHDADGRARTVGEDGQQ